jgi:hypothetical protein
MIRPLRIEYPGFLDLRVKATIQPSLRDLTMLNRNPALKRRASVMASLCDGQIGGPGVAAGAATAGWTIQSFQDWCE